MTRGRGAGAGKTGCGVRFREWGTSMEKAVSGMVPETSTPRLRKESHPMEKRNATPADGAPAAAKDAIAAIRWLT